ncbi:MAG: ABC transporter ATP-binding protein [Thermodesulfobacteriota bacterium]
MNETAPPTDMILLRDIRKSFPLGPVRLEVLKGIGFRMEPGEFVAVTGPSGCGKSTLMNIVGLLDSPTGGSYEFEGRDISRLTDDELSAIRNRKIGFVFQSFCLLPALTAWENACLPLVYRGVPEKRRRDIARRMLDRVGMGERLHHKPRELSGGQQQRVAIARALAQEPSLVLADEPTGALDSDTSREIMELFHELNKKDGLAILMITHDPHLARECGRVVRMKDGLVRESEAR